MFALANGAPAAPTLLAGTPGAHTRALFMRFDSLTSPASRLDDDM